MYFEYNQPCPECQKENKTAMLGFNSDSGKIACTAEIPHEFDSLPGESTPAAEAATEPEKVVSPSEFASEPSVSAGEWTPEEEAALNEAMEKDPRPRDFGSQVVEEQNQATEPGIVVPEPPVTQGEAVLDGFTAEAAEIADTYSPRVGLGEMVILPNGDALCGVRIEEKWVSAMQSESETQRKTFGEYLQELMDNGMIEWALPAPGAR